MTKEKRQKFFFDKNHKLTLLSSRFFYNFVAVFKKFNV